MSYIYNLQDTWANANVAFTSIKMNVAASAYANTSNLLDLLVNDNSAFRITHSGVPITANLSGTQQSLGIDVVHQHVNNNSNLVNTLIATVFTKANSPVYVQNTRPTLNANGTMWFNQDTSRFYIGYNDANGNNMIEIGGVGYSAYNVAADSFATANGAYIRANNGTFVVTNLDELANVSSTGNSSAILANTRMGGTFVWTSANVQSNVANDSAKGVFTAPFGETGSAGAWERVRDRYVNVKWFGAKGDGVTDDTAAIQAAIDAAGSTIPGLSNVWSNLTPRAVVIYFPAGRYRTTATLQPNHNCIMEGEGLATQFVFDPSTANSDFLSPKDNTGTVSGLPGSNSGLFFRNFYVKAAYGGTSTTGRNSSSLNNVNSNTRHCFNFINGTLIRLENIAVFDFHYGTAYRFSRGVEEGRTDLWAYYNSLVGCYARDCFLSLKPTSATNIVNCHFGHSVNYPELSRMEDHTYMVNFDGARGCSFSGSVEGYASVALINDNGGGHGLNGIYLEAQSPTPYSIDTSNVAATGTISVNHGATSYGYTYATKINERIVRSGADEFTAGINLGFGECEELQIYHNNSGQSPSFRDGLPGFTHYPTGGTYANSTNSFIGETCITLIRGANTGATENAFTYNWKIAGGVKANTNIFVSCLVKFGGSENVSTVSVRNLTPPQTANFKKLIKYDNDWEMWGTHLTPGDDQGFTLQVRQLVGSTDANDTISITGLRAYVNGFPPIIGPWKWPEYRLTAPTVGTWRQGEHVWNSSPSANGTPGWICVANGTPGTWRSLPRLITANTVQYVTNLDQLANCNTAIEQNVVVANSTHGGTFVWTGSNVSANVAVDNTRGVFVSTFGGNGSTGAWVRQLDEYKTVKSSWFRDLHHAFFYVRAYGGRLYIDKSYAISDWMYGVLTQDTIIEFDPKVTLYANTTSYTSNARFMYLATNGYNLKVIGNGARVTGNNVFGRGLDIYNSANSGNISIQSLNFSSFKTTYPGQGGATALLLAGGYRNVHMKDISCTDVSRVANTGLPGTYGSQALVITVTGSYPPKNILVEDIRVANTTTEDSYLSANTVDCDGLVIFATTYFEDGGVTIRNVKGYNNQGRTIKCYTDMRVDIEGVDIYRDIIGLYNAGSNDIAIQGGDASLSRVKIRYAANAHVNGTTPIGFYRDAAKANSLPHYTQSVRDVNILNNAGSYDYHIIASAGFSDYSPRTLTVSNFSHTGNSVNSFINTGSSGDSYPYIMDFNTVYCNVANMWCQVTGSGAAIKARLSSIMNNVGTDISVVKRYDGAAVDDWGRWIDGGNVTGIAKHDGVYNTTFHGIWNDAASLGKISSYGTYGAFIQPRGTFFLANNETYTSNTWGRTAGYGKVMVASELGYSEYATYGNTLVEIATTPAHTYSNTGSMGTSGSIRVWKSTGSGSTVSISNQSGATRQVTLFIVG